MGFGQYRNTGIPRLSSYADALARFNNTKPIRGRTDITRPMYPLGRRNRVDWFYMRHCQLTQDVECYLYRTPVVTFKPNGEVWIKSDGWDSISTASFIEEVLPIGACIHDRSLCISANGWHRVPSNGYLKLRLATKEVLNPMVETNHSINRKAANNVRKQYKEFREYGLAMLKLRDGRFDIDEIKAEFNGNYPSPLNGHSWCFEGFASAVKDFTTCIKAEGEDKHMKFYRALLHCARSFGYWMSGLSAAEFNKGLDTVIFGVHRDEVLNVQVLGTGVVKRDRYGKYWRKGWEKYHAEGNTNN